MGHRRHRLVAVACGLVLALVAAGCGGDDDGSAARDPGPETTSTSTTTPPEPEWVMHEGGEGCTCADGSEFVFFSRVDDPERVVLYFQGGGACFTAEMCRFEDGTYKVRTGPDDNPEGGEGIFDLDHPGNPFAGWSMVFVPYCTGDVHIGDATTEYAEGLTVEHNGFPNGMAAYDHLVDTFPDATEVVVTGSSAGGVPVPMFGGFAADDLPDARVTVLADASGGYPSTPLVNTTIGSLWGAYRNLPDWPEAAGVTPEEFGIPDLFVLAGTHDPDIVMGRYDNAHDEVQRSFSALAGITGGLREVLDLNEQRVEAAGVDLSVYVAPGEGHTILGRPALYDLVVEGRSFLDWLTTLVSGEAPGDVRCVDCDSPIDGT